MPRIATVGPAVVEAVNKLTEEGKSRTEAFNQVAKDKDMQPGTVAANFYREARKAKGGSKSNSRKPRQAEAPAVENQDGNGNGRKVGSLAVEIQNLLDENEALKAENETIKAKLAKVESALA